MHRGGKSLPVGLRVLLYKKHYTLILGIQAQTAQSDLQGLFKFSLYCPSSGHFTNDESDAGVMQASVRHARRGKLYTRPEFS